MAFVGDVAAAFLIRSVGRRCDPVDPALLFPTRSMNPPVPLPGIVSVFGNRADGSVPADRSLAEPLVATVARPLVATSSHAEPVHE
jgi:hypothetical protein